MAPVVTHWPARKGRARVATWAARKRKASSGPPGKLAALATPTGFESMLARHTQVLHSEIGSSVNPFNRALQDGGSVQQYLDPATRHGAVMLDHMVNHQAQIIAYVNDYKMMVFTTLPALLLLFLMRRPRKAAPTAEASAAMD